MLRRTFWQLVYFYRSFSFSLRPVFSTLGPRQLTSLIFLTQKSGARLSASRQRKTRSQTDGVCLTNTQKSNQSLPHFLSVYIAVVFILFSSSKRAKKWNLSLLTKLCVKARAYVCAFNSPSEIILSSDNWCHFS